jgi:hypothetical protein
LTPLFRDRLRRIFGLCDTDGDGALSAAEVRKKKALACVIRLQNIFTFSGGGV